MLKCDLQIFIILSPELLRSGYTDRTDVFLLCCHITVVVSDHLSPEMDAVTGKLILKCPAMSEEKPEVFITLGLVLLF